MAASSGKTGRGVTFEMSSGASPDVYTAVANVTAINVAGREAEEVDFTHLASDGAFREFRQGFKDPGTISLEMHFDPINATHSDLLTKFLSGDVFSWRVNFAGAGGTPVWNIVLVGQGFVQNPGDMNVNANDPVGGTATVRVTGPTYFVSP